MTPPHLAPFCCTDFPAEFWCDLQELFSFNQEALNRGPARAGGEEGVVWQGGLACKSGARTPGEEEERADFSGRLRVWPRTRTREDTLEGHGLADRSHTGQGSRDLGLPNRMGQGSHSLSPVTTLGPLQ